MANYGLHPIMGSIALHLLITDVMDNDKFTKYCYENPKYMDGITKKIISESVYEVGRSNLVSNHLLKKRPSILTHKR